MGLDKKLRRAKEGFLTHQADLTPALPNARHWLEFYTGGVVQEARLVGVNLSKKH